MTQAEVARLELVRPTGLSLAAANLDLLLEKLIAVSERLQAQGFSIPSSGKLGGAIKLLKTVFTSGSYPSNRADLEKTAEGISFAITLVQVMEAIPDPIPVGLCESLKKSLTGTMGDSRPSESRRALSELQFGAAIAAGGARVGAPRPRPTRTPDFVATIDTLDFLVEVKRPNSAAKVAAKLSEGIGQCREYSADPIALALDLSDLLPHRVEVGEPTEFEAENKTVFEAVTTSAREYVISPRRSPPQDDVAALFVYAQSTVWVSGRDHPRPLTWLGTHFEVFPKAKQGLIVDQSTRFRTFVTNGYTQILGTANVSPQRPSKPW